MSDETQAAPAASEATRVRSCREAFVHLGKVGAPGLSAAEQGQCARIGGLMTEHPVIGTLLQHFILVRYERATGNELKGSIDWPKIIQWFVENAGTLLPLILSFLTLFGI